MTEKLYTTPLPISIFWACQSSALLSLLSDSGPLPPLLVLSSVKKQLSHRSVPITLPVPGSIAARQGTQLGGQGHRPKWLSFMCATCCSVFIPTVVDLPTHSASHSINWVPMCKDRATHVNGHNPHKLPKPAYSDLHNHIPTLSPLSNSMPMPHQPISATCICINASRHATSLCLFSFFVTSIISTGMLH